MGARARRAAGTAAGLAALAAITVAAVPAGRDAERRTHAVAPGESPIASIQDASLVTAPDPAARLRLMAGLGVRLVRVDLLWDQVARRRPADPRNPADPAYDWARYDRIVAGARAARVQILFTVWGTPAWAADPAVPASRRFPARATRPRDPADFGRFGAAVVRRYAPRGVTRYEAFNEPNLPLFLRPQFERRGGRWVATSPAVYSAMLTSFYREAKAANRRVLIGGGVTAPAGESCPVSCPDGADDRVAPLDFLAALDASGLRPPMDAYTHHPYPLTRPRTDSVDGVSFIDLYNMGDLQKRLDATYLAGKPLWLTEIGFATRPVAEYRFAVAEPDQARLLADAYARVRANPRVEILTWYLLQDHPAWTSGLLTETGRRKPAATAFQLPLAAAPAASGAPTRRLLGQVRVAPGATRVTVERLAGRRWRPVATPRTTSDGSFAVTVGARTDIRYRAVWRGRDRQGRTRTLVSPAVTVRID
ncbi:MAG: hypothetical protein AB1416_11925 [Actinomycetota bacterium]